MNKISALCGPGKTAIGDSPEKRSFQHLNPIWREKANFIIGASIRPLAKNPKNQVGSLLGYGLMNK